MVPSSRTSLPTCGLRSGGRPVGRSAPITSLVLDRRTIVWGEGIRLEEFIGGLTSRQKQYLLQGLLGMVQGEQIAFSAANGWKLRQRLLKLWQAFVDQ